MQNINLQSATGSKDPEKSALPRVLYVNSSSPPVIGGLERQALWLAERLSNRGAHIMFACEQGLSVDIASQAIGLPTVDHRVKNSGVLSSAFKLAAAIRDNKIDLVHVHSRRDYLPAIVAAAVARRGRSRPKVILHMHLVRELAVPILASRIFYTMYVDSAIAVSAACRERIIQDHIIPDSRVRLIYNGIDTDRFTSFSTEQAAQKRIEYRTLWGIPFDAKLIGMLGRLNEKGQEFLVRAMPRLLKELPDLYVVLIGPESKPGQHKWIEDLAVEVGVADRVKVPGPERKDVPGAMTALDAYVHLPIDEAFGLAIVEAGASGLPVIVSDQGGCPEVVEHDVNGFIVDVKTDDALVKAMKALFDPEHGGELRKKLGENGRRRAIENFSIEAQVNAMEEHYLELCR